MDTEIMRPLCKLNKSASTVITSKHSTSNETKLAQEEAVIKEETMTGKLEDVKKF